MRWTFLLAVLMACSDDDGGSPDTTLPTTATSTGTSTGGTSSTAALSVSAAPSPHVRQVPVFTWTAPEPGRSWVSWGPDDTLEWTSDEVTGTADVTITLLGIKAGTEIHYQAHTELADGTVLSSAVETLTTGQPFDEQPLPVLLDSQAGSQVADGFALYSVILGMGADFSKPISFLQIVDGDGDIVWSREADLQTMITSARLSRNGTDILYIQSHAGDNPDLTTLHRVSLDGLTATEHPLPDGHHDFAEHDDGTFGFFAYVTDEANQRASDAVLEFHPDDTAAPQPVFDYFSDYGHPYWDICEHVQGWSIDESYSEWTHSNSLMLDGSGEYYFVMSKFMDSLLKIRRTDGAVMWQLNGLHGDFTTSGGGPVWNDLGETTLFSHGHMSHIWEMPGDPDWTHCMAVFDNGYHLADGDHSSAVEICLNEDTLVAEEIFRYYEPNGGFTEVLGDVRRLDGGYLVGWSSLRRIDELDDSGTVLWSLDMGPQVSGGRVSYLPSL